MGSVTHFSPNSTDTLFEHGVRAQITLIRASLGGALYGHPSTGDPTGTLRSALPPQLREGLDRYIADHIPTGSFLEAVLSNDLSSACARADAECAGALVDIMRYLHNRAPMICFGSPEIYAAWTRYGDEVRHGAKA